MKHLILTIAAILSCTFGFAKESSANVVMDEYLSMIIQEKNPNWAGCWLFDLLRPDSIVSCEYERLPDSTYVHSGSKHLLERNEYGTLMFPVYVLRMLDEGVLSQDTLFSTISRQSRRDTLIALDDALVSADPSTWQFVRSDTIWSSPREILDEYAKIAARAQDSTDANARYIMKVLHRVVWDNEKGTASIDPWRMRKAQSDLVHIAGKTGTMQMRNEQGDGYVSNHHRISFIGIFPEEAPRYICLCVVEKPHMVYDAGTTCGRLVRRVAESLACPK